MTLQNLVLAILPGVHHPRWHIPKTRLCMDPCNSRLGLPRSASGLWDADNAVFQLVCLGKCAASFWNSFTFSASGPERTSLATCCCSIWSEIVEGSEMVCVWGFFPPNKSRGFSEADVACSSRSCKQFTEMEPSSYS